MNKAIYKTKSENENAIRMGKGNKTPSISTISCYIFCDEGSKMVKKMTEKEKREKRRGKHVEKRIQ